MNSEAEIKSGMIRQCTDELYTTEQYEKDWERMCWWVRSHAQSIVTECDKCPLSIHNISRHSAACYDYSAMHHYEARKIVQKWAEEHPELPEKQDHESNT